MSKPDWKDAPEWAGFVAMDDDGTWYWYESEPEQFSDCWRADGRYQTVLKKWDESLESRP